MNMGHADSNRFTRWILVATVAAIAVIAMGATAHADEPVCVVSNVAKLRSGPSTKAGVTWVVGKNMPLERMRREGPWSQVRDLRGQVHWVISKNVAGNQPCAVVRVRNATLRKGPGSAAEIAEFKVAEKYTPFRRVGREGNWVRLEDEYQGSYWTRDTNLWMPVSRSRVTF